ncbi:Cytochrome c biogenesis protein CcdA [Actinokineospora alba]|uniref:Cytochrome c biogenesis protein CcdA n=1 Tax=Actinokineospora alba TaxID=504798 RepID=A0A1H0K8S1_9PSEU|nr:cytochrome c biogenesis protein CcdA [Actinokineospora alba]TDP67995.1 cytochrome c biogenesis protein CcdA [Actinokineospora alba]SDH90383.1 Cytochrome c biogenesis protein CcdA [Actinokineospora alba]SDO52418.1 Cytochrome c biogenesis protein CcdA [Actinokineospora alba]
MGDLGLALVAGMLATVNPCGFAMLPGYLALVGGAKVGRALAAAALMTAGFIAVFGIFGLLTAPFASTLQQYLPVVTVVIGACLVIAGGVLLSGRELPLPIPKPSRGAPSARIVSMIGYGVAYAVASLSCAVGPFLAVAGIALRGGSVVPFVTYGLGMGLVVAVLAVAASMTSPVRRMLPYVNRVGGVLLVVTGLYVGYYGIYELRLFHGDGDPAHPVVEAASEVQGWLVGVLDDLGPVPLVAALAALTLGAVLVAQRRRKAPDQS